MKILHINTYDKGGGAEQFAFDLVHHHFQHSNTETRLLVKRKKTDSDKVEVLKRSFLSHFLEKTDKGLHKISNHTLFSDLSVLKPIHKTFQNLTKSKFYREADIIHLHNIHYDFFDLEDLIRIAKQRPIIWTLHDMWAMTGGEAYTFDNENFKRGIGKTPYKSFHPLLNPMIDRRQKYLEKKKQLYEVINDLKSTQKKGFVFVPVSGWLSDCLKESYVFPKQSKNISIQTIQNGIDTSVFKSLNQRNWTTKRLLFFNSDNPYKGASLFENLIPQISEETNTPFELFVVGKKISTQILNQISNNVKIKHLKPIYDRKKMNELYNAVDILVFPSRAENFSLLMLEAMAAGVCVLGSSAGGIKEQLAEERGVLFENGNREDLREKTKLILQNDLDKIRNVGKKAAEFVEENWNVEKMKVKYMNLYEEILKNQIQK